MKILAIITARGGSKRIPRKNIKEFCGKPIISYSIEAAINSDIFEEVMVSTDDNEIAQLSLNRGAKIPFLRSTKTSDDYATTVDVLIEVIEDYKTNGQDFDYVCCIYPTAPFITSEKLKASFKKLHDNNFNSLLPIVKFDYPIQRALRTKDENLIFAQPQFENSRSQDLESMYHDAGQFYWLKVENFIKEKTLFMKNTTYFELPKKEVWDIDTQEDWEIAEALYQCINMD